MEKRWRYLNFILAYYSFLFFLFSFTGKGRLKGTRIRYESSSLKNIFHFFCHSIFYFHFFFYYIGGTNLETWKVGEIKANDYSREDEKSSSTRWKKISILRCSPAGNLSLATLHPISNVDSYGKGRRPFDSTRDWSIFLKKSRKNERDYQKLKNYSPCHNLLFIPPCCFFLFYF